MIKITILSLLALLFWLETPVTFAVEPTLMRDVSRQPITSSTIQAAEQLLGLQLTEAERTLMQAGLTQHRHRYQQLRQHPIAHDTPPALLFQAQPQQFQTAQFQQAIQWQLPEYVELPHSKDALAFYSVAELSVLLRTQQVTARELTDLFLRRLTHFDPQLAAVITLTEQRARQQAQRADEELAAGVYRGPLHGIPYGVKDLMAVQGYRTTWGAKPFATQMLPETAAVVRKLDAAGAILLGKLSVGALAWGSVWFDGETRNPWNIQHSSGGSSAGPAAALAAGLVVFAIGTETMGSITTPAARCGVTGLRPSFGRVSRDGTMILSWSLDKIGPLCRSAADCALIFDVIRGAEGTDQTVVNYPFNYQSQVDLSQLRIGYLQHAFELNYPQRAHDANTLAIFRNLGADLIPVQLPTTVPDEVFDLIVAGEAAAQFDELTRSGQDQTMVRQMRQAWPNLFRQARFIPAVEYLQANRVRYQLVQQMYEAFKSFDVVLAPTDAGNQLLLTNLVGYPSIVFPTGLDNNGMPTSITLLGNLYDEASILSVAHQFQQATPFETMQPPLFQVVE